jgi:hypothetical protein
MCYNINPLETSEITSKTEQGALLDRRELHGKVLIKTKTPCWTAHNNPSPPPSTHTNKKEHFALMLARVTHGKTQTALISKQHAAQ